MCINISNLSYHPQQNKILSDISLSIDKGERFAFVGDNGSGKTTLLELILGDIKPTEGEISISRSEMKFGVVYDNMPLFPFLKTIEVIKLFSSLYKIKLTRDERDSLVSTFNLDKVKNRPIRYLSAGEKQRISLLLSIVHTPDILVLDEAFSNIDPIFSDKIWEYIISEERIILFTSHNWDSVVKYATKIMFLHNGKQIGEILSPRDHLKKIGMEKKVVVSSMDNPITSLPPKTLWYEMDGFYHIFMPSLDFPESIFDTYSIEHVELKDIYLLYKTKQL